MISTASMTQTLSYSQASIK